jgi:hypothetical protein
MSGRIDRLCRAFLVLHHAAISTADSLFATLAGGGERLRSVNRWLR